MDDRQAKATAAKRKYNEKAYDRIFSCVPKGVHQLIKDYAASKGESVNSLINRVLLK